MKLISKIFVNGVYGELKGEDVCSLRSSQRMLSSKMDTAASSSDAISDKIGSREFPDGRSFPCVWTLFAHWNIHALSPCNRSASRNTSSNKKNPGRGLSHSSTEVNRWIMRSTSRVVSLGY
ncbi:hypothetical protein HNY73_021184 [Argiope bruennichi]|uniref:Uncharacterized protein n=1 Tax=Argiope bruennichi TaxID=94029 RepID=A0A8T0E9B8_ARGBR|nr:hypothetical protein HNY73_021184 [Argiope bruennichi]